MNFRPSSYVLIAFACLVFVFSSGCYRNGVRRSLDQAVRGITQEPKIVADYQPWFGDRNHIDIGYSTQDPVILRKQIQKARELGIYAFAVDWYGERHPFLDKSYAMLQKVAAENNFHVALMYDETEEDTGHATEDALAAMYHAYQNYIGPDAPARSAYLTLNGRPVIFIFPKRGRTDWAQVRAQVNSWEKPPLLVYKDSPPQEYEHAFDGIYAWVHPGPHGWSRNGTEWGEQYLQNFYKKMPEKFPDKFIVGGAWPGFDDSRASWSLNRHMDRRCGKTFEDTLRMFQQNNTPDKPMPFLMIATWNDYEEGTQIEDGVAHCGNQAAFARKAPLN